MQQNKAQQRSDAAENTRRLPLTPSRRVLLFAGGTLSELHYTYLVITDSAGGSRNRRWLQGGRAHLRVAVNQTITSQQHHQQ